MSHSRCAWFSWHRTRWVFFRDFAALFLTALLWTPLGFLEAADLFTEKVTGATFPRSIDFTRRGRTYDLGATGAAVRRKWFTNGYVIAHYMQDPVIGNQEAVLKDVFSDDKAKQMTILWLHRLPVKLIRDSFRESLSKVLGEADNVLLKEPIDKFVGFFKADAEVQDRHYLRWFPGGDVELWYRSPNAAKSDEKLGNLINADLAKALWTIWLGPDSVVDRTEMLKFVLRK